MKNNNMKEKQVMEHHFKAYGYIFSFFKTEHNLILFDDQINEIVAAVEQFKTLLNEGKTEVKNY